MEKIVELVSLVLSFLAKSFKKENPAHGIKELSEAIHGINQVSLVLLKHFADGVSSSDLVKIYTEITSNDELKDAILEAYQGWEQLKSETLDLDIGEGAEIASIQLSYLNQYLQAFKK
jgi:hypothetical protein